MRSLFATTVELPAFLIFSTILLSSSPAISQPLLFTLFRAFIKPPDSEAEKFSHYASLDALPQRVRPNLVDRDGWHNVALGRPINSERIALSRT